MQSGGIQIHPVDGAIAIEQPARVIGVYRDGLSVRIGGQEKPADPVVTGLVPSVFLVKRNITNPVLEPVGHVPRLVTPLNSKSSL
jgi:hypothetical protein